MLLKSAFRFVVAYLMVWNLTASANVVGVGAQNFNTTTNGLDFVTVHSSETLKPGLLNLGLFLNYSVNSLPYYQSTVQGRTDFRDTLLGAEFNFGLGLIENLDIGVSFPYVVLQTVETSNTLRGQFASSGLTEIRANVKYRLFGDDSKGFALVGSTNFGQVRNDPYAGSGAGPTVNLEAAGDYTFGPFAVGLNFGHRWRFPGTPLEGSFIQPLDNQFIASTAANYQIPGADTKLIVEIFGSFPAGDQNSDIGRSLTSAEALAGIKHDFTHQLAFHAGAGTELNHAVSSPDWRVYTGINYVLGPLWSKPKLVRKAPDVRIFTTQDIRFEHDSVQMVGQFASVLTELAVELKRGFRKLTIEGHTDSVGNDAYNLDLSQRRADAIKNYLIQNHSIPDRKIHTKGFGETEPIADNGNFQGRQQNRRVEFKIE